MPPPKTQCPSCDEALHLSKKWVTVIQTVDETPIFRCKLCGGLLALNAAELDNVRQLARENGAKPWPDTIGVSAYPVSEKEILSTDNYLARILRLLFKPSGRVGRVPYAFAAILIALDYIVLSLAFGNIRGSLVLWLMFGAPWFFFEFVLTFKRLHDVDRTGWLGVLLLVPIANVAMSLALIFISGTLGPNRFGLPPKPQKMPDLLGMLAIVGIPVWFLVALAASRVFEFSF